MGWRTVPLGPSFVANTGCFLLFPRGHRLDSTSLSVRSWRRRWFSTRKAAFSCRKRANSSAGESVSVVTADYACRGATRANERTLTAASAAQTMEGDTPRSFMTGPCYNRLCPNFRPKLSPSHAHPTAVAPTAGITVESELTPDAWATGFPRPPIRPSAAGQEQPKSEDSLPCERCQSRIREETSAEWKLPRGSPDRSHPHWAGFIDLTK